MGLTGTALTDLDISPATSHVESQFLFMFLFSSFTFESEFIRSP